MVGLVMNFGSKPQFGGMIACDIDGTYMSGFRPSERDYVFISNRLTDQWSRTIADVGTKRPIYLRPPEFEGEWHEWKVLLIRALKITKLYEDNPKEAVEIKRECPECRIVMVKDGQVVDEDFES